MQMRGSVFCDGRLAGHLERTSDGYRFTYEPEYASDPTTRAVSLTLPKQQDPHTCPVLFPFFFGLLAEGSQKEIQCRVLKLDENDHFGRLLRTACDDVIGNITVAGED